MKGTMAKKPEFSKGTKKSSAYRRIVTGDVNGRSVVQSDEQMQAYLRTDPNGRFAPKIKMIMQKMESMGVLHTLPARVGPPPPK